MTFKGSIPLTAIKKVDIMNKKFFESEKIRRLYKTPGGPDHCLRPRNAVFISTSNSLRHELAKFLGSYMLRKWGDVKFDECLLAKLLNLDLHVKELMNGFPKNPVNFITEAVIISNFKRRVDLVSLSDGTVFEFELDHRKKKEGACSIYI